MTPLFLGGRRVNIEQSGHIEVRSSSCLLFLNMGLCMPRQAQRNLARYFLHSNNSQTLICLCQARQSLIFANNLDAGTHIGFASYQLSTMVTHPKRSGVNLRSVDIYC